MEKRFSARIRDGIIPETGRKQFGGTCRTLILNKLEDASDSLFCWTQELLPFSPV